MAAPADALDALLDLHGAGRAAGLDALRLDARPGAAQAVMLRLEAEPVWQMTAPQAITAMPAHLAPWRARLQALQRLMRQSGLSQARLHHQRGALLWGRAAVLGRAFKSHRVGMLDALARDRLAARERAPGRALWRVAALPESAHARLAEAAPDLLWVRPSLLHGPNPGGLPPTGHLLEGDFGTALADVLAAGPVFASDL